MDHALNDDLLSLGDDSAATEAQVPQTPLRMDVEPPSEVDLANDFVQEQLSNFFQGLSDLPRAEPLAVLAIGNGISELVRSHHITHVHVPALTFILENDKASMQVW
jgi:hypothetical protein